MMLAAVLPMTTLGPVRLMSAVDGSTDPTAIDPGMPPPAVSGPESPLGTVTSPMWAGYSVDGQAATFTDVKARWVEPAIACAKPVKPEAPRDLFWIGLDGVAVTDHTVEQTGTMAWCSKTTPFYTAFFEMYPRPLKFGFYVHVGDRLAAEVKWEGGKEYRLSLVDLSSGKRMIETESQRALRSSAEWVAEKEIVCHCLDDFGHVTFSDASATGNGTTGGIDAFHNRRINMINPGNRRVRAEPGPLHRNGTSFSVTWKSP